MQKDRSWLCRSWLCVVLYITLEYFNTNPHYNTPAKNTLYNLCQHMLLCPLTIRIVWEERNDQFIYSMLHILKEYKEGGGTKSTFHNTFTIISVRFSFEYQGNCFDLQCLSNSIQNANSTNTWANFLSPDRTSSAINSRTEVIVFSLMFIVSTMCLRDVPYSW